MDPELGVLAEPHALERALTNLIDNARRYGAQPIRITTRAGGEWVELHVLDHGMGFADDYLPHAFERFSRPTGQRGGGAGLGLALVEAVGGALTLESPSGGGTRLRAVLPHDGAV